MKPRIILVIEDDQDWRELLSDLLLAEGFDVSTSANRDEALQLLEDGDKPALVISDLMMPGISADAFLEQMAKMKAGRIPVIVMSAASERDVPSPPGVSARFQKPVDIPRLLAVVQKHVKPKS